MGLDARDISVNGFESSLDELRAKGFSLTIGPDDDRPLMTRVICRRDDEEIRFGTGPSTGGVRRVFVPLPAGFLSSTRQRRERFYHEVILALERNGGRMLEPPQSETAAMNYTTAIRVQSLDHVTIVVKDLAATRRFYVEVLGMDEVARPNFSFAGQWFQAGATLIHTILEFEGSGPAGLGGGANTRGHHFAFLVEDANEAARQIEALGIPFVSPPKQRPDGAVQLFLHDPDGHLVELCSIANTAAQ